MQPSDPRGFFLVLVVVGFAIYELAAGHHIDQATALTLLYTGLGAGGVAVAHTAGVRAGGGSNPTPGAPQ